VSSHLEGILELNPMWIFGDGFSNEGWLVIFLGVQVETKDRTITGRIAKKVTNVYILDTRLVSRGNPIIPRLTGRQ
jgi:hypothetical protein